MDLLMLDETDITGGLAYLTTFVNNFRTKVTTDLGTFEAYSCLYSSINGELSDGGALLIPFE